MAGEQSLVPGAGFVNETDSKQNLVPGAGYVNETVAAAGGTALTIPAANIAVAANAPTVGRTANQAVTIPKANIAVAANAPTISQSAAGSVTIPVATIVVAANAPTINRTQSVTVPKATITVAANPPAISQVQNQSLAIPAASITVAANAPTINRTQSVLSPAAPIVVRAYAPTIINSGVITVIAPAQGAGTGGRRRQQRRYVVEIDDKAYVVNTIAEARAILGRAQKEAVAEAPAAAKKVLNKARDVERKTGEWPEVEVEAPEIEVGGDPSETLRQLAERAQQQINDAYAKAVQESELAFRLRRAIWEQDEEDAIALLLLS